jgi:hypothetical protein
MVHIRKTALVILALAFLAASFAIFPASAAAENNYETFTINTSDDLKTFRGKIASA